MSVSRIERCYVCGEAVLFEEAIFDTIHKDFRHDYCYSPYIKIYKEIDDYQKGLSKRNSSEVLQIIKDITFKQLGG